MADQIYPVRFLYRSESMIPMLTIMERAGIWEKHGINVRGFSFMSEAIEAEEQLLDGGIDFIFGNHVTPYMRLAQGEDMVCMAQTENWLHEWVVTAPQISSIPLLAGKRVVGVPLFLEGGKFSGHGNGNRGLLLELEGVDTRTVEFLMPETVGNAIEAVRDGKAEGCFISPHNAARAEAAGLVVHRLLPMPMVHNITYTTTYTRLKQQEDFAERIVKVLVESTAFFKMHQEESKDMIKNPIDDRMRQGQLDRLLAHYDEACAEHETKLYPRPEALINVHKLACMVYPEAKQTNPMELWDVSTLRALYAKGFVDQVYGGKQKVQQLEDDTFDFGTCMEDC